MGSILIKEVLLSEKAATGPVDIFIEDGRIISVNNDILSREADVAVDGSDLTAFPGFVDIHIHGAVGVDVNEGDADSMLRIAAFLAKNGVTSWVPTLVPDSDANYERVIDEIDRLMTKQAGRPVAQAVGVHYEGVFANEKMCGALRPEYFKRFSENGKVGLPVLKSGVHLTTLAPEAAGGIDLIRQLIADGWIPLIGHTRADATTLDAAFAAGARHITHFFNAMTGVHHRDLGVAGWTLTNDMMTFDIIADGIHVEPRILKMAVDSKRTTNVTLISDSVAPTGLGDGRFELWGETVSVVNGRTQNERGSIAGSVITMLDAFRQMSRLGYSGHDLSIMSALNPARLLGLDGEIGSLDVGKYADIVLIDKYGTVKRAFVRGVPVE